MKDMDLVISHIQEMISAKLLIRFFFFFEKQYADKYPLIDLLKFNYRKVKMDDKLRVFYGDFFYNKGASFKKKYLSVDYVDWFI